MNTSLADKWILITGASSGFGAASAIAFAKQGAKLLLGARRLEKLEEVRSKALAAGSPAAMVHRLDVASTESVSAFTSWAKARTQRVDVLLNNAGGAHGADHVADSKDADWEAMFQSNVLGLLRVTRAVLPLMPHDAGASIIRPQFVRSKAGRQNAGLVPAPRGAACRTRRAPGPVNRLAD